MTYLKKYIRDIPDFPEPGILFRDISPLLADSAAFEDIIDRMTERYQDAPVDVLALVESRGFIFGAPLAHRLGKPFVLVRKPGKLPAAANSVEYTLEYGASVLEMHQDAIAAGDRVLVVDDVLATGGTLAASARLVEMAGGVVAGIGVIIELTGLEGRRHLEGYDVFSLIEY